MRLLMITQAVNLDDPVLGFTHGWVNALAQQVTRLHVVTLHAGRRQLADNVTLHAFGPPQKTGGTLRRHAFYHAHFARLIGGGQVDAIFAHMIPKWVAMAWPYARLRGVPLLLWYTHGSVSRPLRLAHRLATHVVTASPQSYPLPGGHVTALGHGIDTDYFRPGETTRANGRFRLLMVGRLTPTKQPHLLIDAVRRLAQQGVTDIDCRIVGGAARPEDVAYRHTLAQTVAAAQLATQVTLAGPVPYTQIRAEYQQADLVVNLSRTNSLDKTVLEAMACGVPVVTSNPSFMPLLQPLDPALLVTHGDVDGLVTAVRHIYDMPSVQQESLGAALRAQVQQRHNLERLMQKLIELVATL